MKRTRFYDEQIIAALKEHEAGARIPNLARRHSVSEHTVYRWKSKDGGRRIPEAKRLRIDTMGGRVPKTGRLYLLYFTLAMPPSAGLPASDGRVSASRTSACGAGANAASKLNSVDLSDPRGADRWHRSGWYRDRHFPPAQAREQGKQTKGPASYQEVGCVTISFYDAEGERLATTHHAGMPERNTATLKTTLSADIEAVLAVRSELRRHRTRSGDFQTSFGGSPSDDDCGESFPEPA